MALTYGLYYGVTVLACLFAWLAERGREQEFTVWKWKISKAAVYLTLAAIPMVLLSGLRWETGIDSQNYFWLFTNIHYNLANHAEIGFYLLCQFIWYFAEDMAVLFFLCALITVTFMMLAIRKSSGNYFISVFLYLTMGYFFYSMNSMRHFMALAIFLFAYQFMKQRRFWPYLAWVLVAASFHKIALIAIPLYFLLNIKFKPYWYAIFSGGLIGVAIFHRQLLDFIYSFVFGFYADKEAEYVSVSYVNILICLALSVLVFLYRKKLLERNPRNIILMNAAWLGLIFFATCHWIPQYTRLGQYLTLLTLFLVPEIFACEDRPKVRRLYWIGLIAGFTLFLGVIIWNAQAPNIDLAPYQSVLQREHYDDQLAPFWFLPG